MTFAFLKSICHPTDYSPCSLSNRLLVLCFLNYQVLMGLMCPLGWSCKHNSSCPLCTAWEWNRVTKQQQCSRLKTHLDVFSDCSWAHRNHPLWAPDETPSLHHDSCLLFLLLLWWHHKDDQATKADAFPKHDGCCEGCLSELMLFLPGPKAPPDVNVVHQCQPISFSHTHSGSQHEFLSGYGGNLSVTENALHRTVFLDLGSFSPTWTCVLRFLLRTFQVDFLRDPSSQPKLDRIQVWTQLRLRLDPWYI